MAGGTIGAHFSFQGPTRPRTNLPASNITNFVKANSREIVSRQLRIATGRRTLRVEDGAAFYAIAKKTETQLRAKESAIKNIGDAKDLLSVAESALLQIDELLGRMRDIAVRAGNDTLTSQQREDMAKELANLAEAIDEIASRTRFNETDLMFDGNFEQSYQVGPHESTPNIISVRLRNLFSSALGVDPAGISVATNTDARTAITAIDAAVGEVKNQLIRLGAIQSELTSLENVLSDSTTAEASIKSLYGDADLGEEQAMLARLNLFNQIASGQAAAANALPGLVLNMLL